MFTQKEAEEQLEKLFQKWNSELFPKSQDLLGVLQFGSTTKSPIKYQTDLDLLLIFNKLPASRWDRFLFTEPLENRLNEDLKTLVGFNISVSIISKESNKLTSMQPYYLDFPTNSIIRFDPNNLLEELLKNIKEWMTDHGSKRVDQGNLWYWIYDTIQDPSIPVSFEFKKK